jgi:hypothetical protein
MGSSLRGTLLFVLLSPELYLAIHVEDYPLLDHAFEHR